MVTSADATVCTSSGLNIVPSAGRRIFRVARSEYGPLNPPVRLRDVEVEKWSRWDTPGRTIYGGSTAPGAFVEVLEYITPDPPATPLSELFDDVGPDDAATFGEQVARELPGHGAMPYRSISQGWRQVRSTYELRLPSDGWFVNITGAESISVLSRELRPLLDQCSMDQLTMSELTSSAEEMKDPHHQHRDVDAGDGPPARRCATARYRLSLQMGQHTRQLGDVATSHRRRHRTRPRRGHRHLGNRSAHRSPHRGSRPAIHAHLLTRRSHTP